MNEKHKITVMLLMLLVTGGFAQVRFLDETGVGVRALSLANNTVASVNDMSAAYWNPAAFAFLPIRSFQFGLTGTQLQANTEFFGVPMDDGDQIQRIRLSSAGMVNAVPTSQGGLTWSIGFQSPLVFDDLVAFRGEDSTTSYLYDSDYRTFGGLRLWTGAFGVQVAPGASLGLAVSLLTGSEQTDDLSFIRNQSSGEILEDFEYTAKTKYIGYDVRAGFMYRAWDILTVGMRFVYPRVIAFTEDFQERYPNTSKPEFEQKYSGKLISSFSGAGGVSIQLPFMTIATEVRARAPYSFLYPTAKIPSGAQAKRFVGGAGLGFEIPVVVAPLVLRTGYSVDQTDLHPFAVEYKGEKIGWSDEGIVPSTYRHFVTAGVGFLTQSIALDFGAGYRFWALDINDGLPKQQDVKSVVVNGSLGFRY